METIRFNIQHGWNPRLTELTGVLPDEEEGDPPVGVTRYTFDFNLPKGWAQFDTSADASYLGGWTNPKRRAILTYVEGDVELRTFETDEEYARALWRWIDASKACGRFKGIDAMLHEPLTDALTRLGFADALH